MKELTKYIQTRINTIQKRCNFNPDLGLSQIKNRNDLVESYIQFRTLLDIINTFKLNVDIKYTGSQIEINKTRQEFVYFAREDNTNSWKIGWSKNPEKRVKHLQVANKRYLYLVFKVSGDRELETLIKRYLKKYKTRNHSTSQGEWFNIEHSKIETLVKHLNKFGRNFLRNSTLAI